MIYRIIIVYSAFLLYTPLGRTPPPKKQERLKLNGANQLLVYADGVNLCIAGKLKCHKENTETLLDDSKIINLEVNKESIILHVKR
jgi:hypothetical protein